MILALDIGTSSVRAAVYGYSGNVLPESVVKNFRTVNFTEDGGAELNAGEALGQVEQAISDVLAKTTARIEYVAVSCFWHSLIGIDESGSPTTKVFTWAETRPAPHVKKLRETLDETEIHNRTGCRFHSSYWPAKLLWLKEEFPEIFAKTQKWLSFADYMAFRLSGELRTSVSMASGSGIFDIRNCIWDGQLLDYLGISGEDLPEIGDDGFFFQSNHWDRLKEAKWFLAIGDGAANNIGAGCLKKDKAALMIGTSGAMRVAFEGGVPEKIPFGLWCYRIDKKRVIIGGALSDGGGLYAWLKDTLKIAESDDALEAEIAKREPDSHGLTFLPFLAGERSTGYHEAAKGAIIGLTQHTTAVEITQAAMESVAYRFRAIFEEIEKFTKLETIIASGGALRESPVWTQIVADVLEKDLYLPDTREASSRGAVLLALENGGKLNGISELQTPKGMRFEPRNDYEKLYLVARRRNQRCYELLIGD